VNPGTINAAYLDGLLRLGANRISIGAQSFCESELRLLGRIHSVSDISIAVRDARSAGFTNINLDLIYGLPGQAIELWQMTMEQALELRPDHLSLYALSLEETVPLHSDIESGILPRPDDDYVATMYTATVETLRQAGWGQYELSNWARTPEFRCRHNLMYWNNHHYWGVGAAAHSWYQHTRRWNVIGPLEYIQKIEAGIVPTAGFEHIDRNLEMGETAILSLRMMAGLRVADFSRRFGVNPLQMFAAAIKESVSAGLLAENSKGVNLTEKGKLLSNEVFWRILRDARTEREN
jgi:oxygen-independent coproporphyrinogen-3 oxidase